MDYFVKIVSQMVKGGSPIAGICLCAGGIIMIANIIYRFFGGIIIGTYELVEMAMAVTIAFALSYTALSKGHVVVPILMSRFPERVRSIFDIFNSLFSLFFGAVIAWASIGVIREKLITGEITLELELSLVPIRIIWVLGLLLFCLVALREILTSIRQRSKR